MRNRRRASGLSARDKGVLDIETKWGPGPAAQPMKLQEAREQLGLSPAGYSLVLSALLDDPVAHATAPETIARLREIRDSRRGALALDEPPL